MKIVNSTQMAKIDQETQKSFGIPDTLLMENAGQKIYTCINKHILKNAGTHHKIVFLVGKGNNGGDALVIARQYAIESGNNVSIIIAQGEPASTSLAFMHLKICRALKLEIIDYSKEREKTHKSLAASDIIIDGILGTGISGQVREPLHTLISSANKSSAFKIAIDVPSGIGDNFKKPMLALKADYTFTVELPKLCLYLPYARPFCGSIQCVKIGFPGKALQNSSSKGELLEFADFFKLLPVISKHAHKSMRGHCAVFAGSVGTTGAAYLSTMAAARSRVGLVTLFTDTEVYPHLTAKFSSAMIQPLPDKYDKLQEIKHKYSGLLIGPGWGVNDKKLKVLERLLACELPGVIDADGITLLAEYIKNKKPIMKNNFVLTPHPGEFVRLCGGTVEELLNDPFGKLIKVSKQLNTPIILKGHVSYLVSADGDFWVLDGMNPALATGGSGDVLAGIIAGFIAGGIDVIVASKLGLLLHAKIGEYLYNRRGWFLAEDMITVISQALHRAEENPIWQ